MDDGRLTDGEGRTVDFTNTVVVMTSNLGAGQARARRSASRPREPAAEAERMLAAAKAAFLPEFLNRIDEIVTFRAAHRRAGRADRRAWSARGVADRLRDERGIELDGRRRRWSPASPREGFDEEFGARPLKRHVRRTLERALTRAILDRRARRRLDYPGVGVLRRLRGRRRHRPRRRLGTAIERKPQARAGLGPPKRPARVAASARSLGPGGRLRVPSWLDVDEGLPHGLAEGDAVGGEARGGGVRQQVRHALRGPARART